MSMNMVGVPYKKVHLDGQVTGEVIKKTGVFIKKVYCKVVK